jgi:hypothetical protein
MATKVRPRNGTRNDPNGMGRPTAKRVSTGGRQPRSDTQSASTGLDAPGSSSGAHRARMTSSREFRSVGAWSTAAAIRACMAKSAVAKVAH